ncbi:hypothetical protein P7C73_g6480, partial [Tremellales sp. Uapishka_1]
PPRPRHTSLVSSTSTSRSQLPPPSAFFRKSRSQDLLSGLTLFAAGSDKDNEKEAETIVMSTTSPPLPPPKKSGFFRRISTASSTTPPKSTRSASGQKHDIVAGPEYGALPPSNKGAYRQPDGALKQPEGVRERSASKDRGMFTRASVNRDTPPTTPGASSTQPPVSTPIAAAFSRSQAYPSPPTHIPPVPVQSLEQTRKRTIPHLALASPPTSPPKDYPGRLTSSPPQMYSKPNFLEGLSKGVEGIRLENGHAGPSRPGRQSLGPSSIHIPPKNKMTYEIIASSNNTPRAVSNPTTPKGNHFGSPPPLDAAFAPPPPLPSSVRDMIPKSNSTSQVNRMLRSESMGSGRFEDAEGQGGAEHLLANGSNTSMTRPSKRVSESPERSTRPVVSGRRSNSIGRQLKPVVESPLHTPRPPGSKTASDTTPTTAVPAPTLRRPPSSYFTPQVAPASKPAGGNTEASAYARAIAPTLASHQADASPLAKRAEPLGSKQPTSAAPPVPNRRVSRPLPLPPAPTVAEKQTSPVKSKQPLAPSTSPLKTTKQISPTSPRATMLVIASNDGSGRRPSMDALSRKDSTASSGRKTSTDGGRVVSSNGTNGAGEKKRPMIVIPNIQENDLKLDMDEKKDKRRSTAPVVVEFPRSPTLPPLEDPRLKPQSSPDVKNPIERWANEVSRRPLEQSPVLPQASPPLQSQYLPPRMSSAVPGRRVASSPLASPVFSQNGKMQDSPTQYQSFQPRSVSAAQSRIPTSPFAPAAVQRQSLMTINSGSRIPVLHPRGRRRPSLQLVLSQPMIQHALLPCLSINSFLSLTGSHEEVRRHFSGEVVGRWVMKEWGVQVDRERGRSWPGLTVWEGFLESLLHDPASYASYSAQYHSLLQHLCLSHSLIVLHLRSLPESAFSFPAPLPFEDENSMAAPHMAFSNSMASLSSIGNGQFPPRSRMSSTAGSDAGSTHPGKMPRQERLVEIIMPEPLGSQPKEELASPTNVPVVRKARRRGSISSIASVTSFAFGRKRANSTATGSDIQSDMATNVTGSAAAYAAPMLSGKVALPPVSYPAAKRYGFKRHGDPAPARSRNSSESGRPGSVFSIQSSASTSYPYRMGGSNYASSRTSFAVDRNAPPVPGMPSGLPMPPPIGGGHRASFTSSEAGRSSQNSPVQQGRFGSPTMMRREFYTPPPRAEPAFDKPMPYVLGRAPILRVFVPLSEKVQRWPSAEGAASSWKELEKCGATKRLRLGDLVVNTAIRQPQTTEHVLVFVPFIQHRLVPLEYTYCETGHLPGYLDAFALAPSYYYPFLPSPQIVFLNLGPFAQQAISSMRLAHDRTDVTVASGARLTAKRYLHVAGFEVNQTHVNGGAAHPEWQGMVSLETEGTAEGKEEMERRCGWGDGRKTTLAPWEVVREKSMLGTVWLRLVREAR